jgi:hypothetical protein
VLPLSGVWAVDGGVLPRAVPPVGWSGDATLVEDRRGVVVAGVVVVVEGTAPGPSSRVAAKTPTDRAAAAPTALATIHRRRLPTRAAATVPGTGAAGAGGGGGSGVPKGGDGGRSRHERCGGRSGSGGVGCVSDTTA